MAARVLVCDDAPGFRIVMVTALEAAGLEAVGPACSWEEAIDVAADEQPDAIVVDLWMPTFDPEYLARLSAASPNSLLFVVSVLPVEEAEQAVAGVPNVAGVYSKRTPTRAIAELVRDGLVTA